ncbi:MAG: tetratricopeptide repeat protein [Prevotella sp.]|nr:tetratricopeptide repeat protein [Prevotella sp.]
MRKTSPIGLLFLISYFLFSASASAQTKADADSAYVQGNYQKAIELYSELLKEGQSADVYYNLGNAYYRTEEITQAILAYERALLLSPGDADIRFNLQLARTKTIDKMVPQSEFFAVTWYRSLVNQMSVDGWARMSLVLLALTIVLALLYLFASPVWLRKVGFFGGLLALLFFLLANLFAWQQKQTLNHRDGAIIIQSAVPVKSTPSTSGTDLFILHEGTKVTVTDDTMQDWKEIRMPDGKVGWVETAQIEII